MAMHSFRPAQDSMVATGRLDTSSLADACNEDRRFQEAGWIETPVSIERLLLSDAFHLALAKLAPMGGQLVLERVIANTFRCRLEERGSPKRAGSSKWHDRPR